MKYYYNKVGYPLSFAEVNFFNAYRLHADRLGAPQSTEVTKDEINTKHWKQCLDDYEEKYPEAVARFANQ